MRALAMTIALVGGAMLAGPTASAQSNDLDQEARALFEAGRVAFDAGRYEDALEHFDDAYARSRRPRLLYNVGLAADRAGRVDLAIRAYSKFLDSVEDSPHRATVEGRLAELRAQGASPPDPIIQPQPQPQPEVPIIMNTPTPTPEPAQQSAPVAPQPQTQAQPQAQPQPNGQPRMAEPPNRTGPILAIVGGAALALGGVALIGLSFSAKAEAEDEIMWPRANDANERARRRSGSGFVLGAVGVVAALVGIVWLKVSDRAAYGLTLGPSHLGVEGRF
ncbi:MAG: tetratricopeptide repeat protein [Deltaproteobacteria bacterium]|nr:tetratricopeptide repeat protein [Deltaproteobacteria bacterium]